MISENQQHKLMIYNYKHNYNQYINSNLYMYIVCMLYIHATHRHIYFVAFEISVAERQQNVSSINTILCVPNDVLSGFIWAVKQMDYVKVNDHAELHGSFATTFTQLYPNYTLHNNANI